MLEVRTVHDNEEGSPNLDPLTGQSGAHPIGVGMGAGAAGVAGAAIGSAVGPIGTIVGAVVGAVVGGLAGKDMAEAVDPTVEDAYWRDNHATRSYATGTSYEEFEPAYRYGWESRAKHAGRSFDEVETDLSTNWSADSSRTKLGWSRARPAVRDAWDRVETNYVI